MTHIQWFALVLGCKATLILGLVAALVALAGRRWPQNCRLWQRSGVVALLALPLAAWALPPVGIPVLSAERPGIVADKIEHGRQLATPVPLTARGETTRNPSASPPATSPTETAALSPPSASFSILGLFLAAYGAVVVALMVRFVCAWHGLAQLKQGSSVVGDPIWQTTLKRWSAVLRVDRPVELRVSDAVSVPMTFGWRTPVILVPGDCLSTCDQAQRDAIVVHELTHIAHGDFFWQALTRLAAALYWVHPLVWLIGRQDRTLCERICDALCSQQLSRESYARALVQIAGRKIFRPAPALGIAMARSCSLARRLTDLQTGAASRCSPPNRTQRALLSGAAGLILGLIAVGTLTARASAEGPQDEPPTPATEKPAAPSPQPADAQADSTKAARVRLPDTIDGRVVDHEDKRVVGASVTVTIRRYNPYIDPADPAAPRPWTASTDDDGRFQVQIGAPSLGPDDDLRVEVRADGFADSSESYDARAAARGTLPVQRLHPGRTIRGRLVDPQGNPLTAAIVRFQAATSDLKMTWDSGPLPIGKDGTFSVAIPKPGQAAFVIYPRGFAPQLVDVPDNENDLRTIGVESGTALTGRVVDAEGRGVAGTVVAIKSEEVHLLFLYGVRIATAVKTDDAGHFRLPPVRGSYIVSVTSLAPDYPRQRVVTGVQPPPILPRRIDISGAEKTREIVLREAPSVTVRGTVRRADSPVPNLRIRAALMPGNWESGVDLATVRTDSQGDYLLRLPATTERVVLSVDQVVKAPDGTFQRARAVGRGAEGGNFIFPSLTGDVDAADWVVGREE